MDNVTKISVNALKIHPKNQEFFDDIEGEQYEIFKKSIIEEGIITPLIIAPDMTVISGHQRLKACKELGIEYVPVIIDDDLQDETLKLKRLIASNFGRLKNNPMKQARVIAEYEKLCGIKHGGDRKSSLQNANLNQEDIAKELGIDVSTLWRLKQLQNLIPELQDLVEKGELNWTTAVKIWARLPREEQQKFIEQIGINNISNMTAKETEQAIEKIKQQLVQEQEKNKELMQKLDELSNRPPEVKTIIPDDYHKIKSQLLQLQQQLDMKNTEFKKMLQEKEMLEQKVKLNEKEANEYQSLKRNIDMLKHQKEDIARQIEATESISGLVVEIENLLQTKLAPIKYSRAIAELSDDEIVVKNLEEIIDRVEAWCNEMKGYLPNSNTINVEGYVYGE